jgi:hypothetical protein
VHYEPAPTARASIKNISKTRDLRYDATLAAFAVDLEPVHVNRNRLAVILCAALLAPVAAAAATVAASSIPDGTYTVKVVRVIDAQHVDVLMDDGNESTLAAGRPNVNFSKIQANDQIKLSIIKGSVMVFLDLTAH